MYEVEEKPKTGIDPVGRYCKYCKDRYYNHSDVDSIKKNLACVFCFRELKFEAKDDLSDLKD